MSPWGGVGLIVGAIERVNAGAITAQGHNDGTVSVEHDCSFTIALFGTGCDRLVRGFDRREK
jgi:hypothetical protein